MCLLATVSPWAPHPRRLFISLPPRLWAPYCSKSVEYNSTHIWKITLASMNRTWNTFFPNGEWRVFISSSAAKKLGPGRNLCFRNGREALYVNKDLGPTISLTRFQRFRNNTKSKLEGQRQLPTWPGLTVGRVEEGGGGWHVSLFCCNSLTGNTFPRVYSYSRCCGWVVALLHAPSRQHPVSILDIVKRCWRLCLMITLYISLRAAYSSSMSKPQHIDKHV